MCHTFLVVTVKNGSRSSATAKKQCISYALRYSPSTIDKRNEICVTETSRYIAHAANKTRYANVHAARLKRHFHYGCAALRCFALRCAAIVSDSPR